MAKTNQKATRRDGNDRKKAESRPSADELNRQLAEADGLARAIPHNPTKKAEHGRDNALDPPQGATATPPSPAATASTLSEANLNAKTEGTAPGAEGGGRLERYRVDSGGRALTTNQGVAVADNQNSLKDGLRGPTLLQDFILREKLTTFDHERIPERVVHARGSAAHGYFEASASLSELTRAAPFAEKGKRTPVFVRFSTVAGERGSVDTARDVRGFAIKFYTEEGNWDLVGNNIPVFFIQDAIKFPDLVHAVKPEPHNGVPQAASAHDTFWDFVSLTPESTHMLMWVMSDRAIPRSFRMMAGFGVHTFRLVNADGAAHFVKFHFRPKLGTHSLVWDEAARIQGADNDYHRRDLWEAIESGAYPEWEMGLQVFTEEEAQKWSFDVLDATKIIPEELVPLRIVGRLVLDRNPDNFFAETEQVAFCTAHVIPGIDFSNDPLLAGRIHSYLDTQITRLGGPNFHEIPINAPLAAVHNNQRDGLRRVAVHRGRVAYEPNSLAGGCPFQAGRATGFVSFPQPAEGEALRGKPEKFAEHYQQATLFWNSQTAFEKAHIVGGFRFELSKVKVPAIRERMVAGLRNVSEELARAVADGLGMAELPPPLPRAADRPAPAEVDRSPALSLTAQPGDGSIRTRKVAILVADGVDTAAVKRLSARLQQEGAAPQIVAPRLGKVKGASGDVIDADATLENSPAVLFDALALPGGKAAAEALVELPATAEFVSHIHRHCKTLLAVGDARALLESLAIPAALPSGAADEGVLTMARLSDEGVDAFVDAVARHRHMVRERL